MQLNKSTDYAINVLLHLRYKNKLKNLNDIAEATKIPPKYLKAILSKLRKAGYVDSMPGINGGYFLKEELSNITVYDIISVMESSATISHCLLQRNDITTRHIRNYYNYVQRELEKNVFAVTLYDILNDY